MTSQPSQKDQGSQTRQTKIGRHSVLANADFQEPHPWGKAHWPVALSRSRTYRKEERPIEHLLQGSPSTLCGPAPSQCIWPVGFPPYGGHRSHSHIANYTGHVARGLKGLAGESYPHQNQPGLAAAEAADAAPAASCEMPAAAASGLAAAAVGFRRSWSRNCCCCCSGRCNCNCSPCCSCNRSSHLPAASCS